MLLTRTDESEYGTFGVLVLGSFRCFTLELPWRGNRRCVSRIPAGTYAVAPYSSAKYRQALRVLDVPEREAILIHQGNWAGDREQGLLCNVLGCILVGDRRGIIKGQPGLGNSVVTLGRLCKLVTEKTSLEIKE